MHAAPNQLRAGEPEALDAMAASYGGACSLANHHGRCHRVARGDTRKHRSVGDSKALHSMYQQVAADY
jgi:hypothetical protein